MSFRGVKRRGNPLNRNKNRLTIATNRISPRAYYRTENLYYQFEQGQELLPQLRQIICLVEVGRDTHTRLEWTAVWAALNNTSCECVVAKANEADCIANAEVQTREEWGHCI